MAIFDNGLALRGDGLDFFKGRIEALRGFLFLFGGTETVVSA